MNQPFNPQPTDIPPMTGEAGLKDQVLMQRVFAAQRQLEGRGGRS